MSDTTDPGGATHVGIKKMVGYPCGLPLSSHPPPERLSRELPAVGHGDRCNDDPKRGGQYEVPGQEGHP